MAKLHRVAKRRPHDASAETRLRWAPGQTCLGPFCAHQTNSSSARNCAAGVLSATPVTYSLRRDDSDFVVFCFAKAEDAEALAKRFDGERLATGSRR
jgi:hypothetical protein